VHDPRIIRLFDLIANDRIVLRCPCGHIIEFGPGHLQRKHKVPSTTLVFDLQYWLKCARCNRREGYEIAIVDTTHRGDNSNPKSVTIVVKGEFESTGRFTTLAELYDVPLERRTMISDLDIWRTAKMYIDQYGDNASMEAAKMFDAMTEKGDLDGRLVWNRVYQAILEFTKMTSSAPPH